MYMYVYVYYFVMTCSTFNRIISLYYQSRRFTKYVTQVSKRPSEVDKNKETIVPEKSLHKSRVSKRTFRGSRMTWKLVNEEFQEQSNNERYESRATDVPTSLYVLVRSNSSLVCTFNSYSKVAKSNQIKSYSSVYGVSSLRIRQLGPFFSLWFPYSDV